MLRWESIPALAALQFAGERAALTDAEWEAALYYCDRHQITLLLGDRAESRRVKNRVRVARLKREFWEVKEALDAAGIEFAMLKGFTHWGQYWPDPDSRVQYDLDLYCPEAATAARDALLRIGYVPWAAEDSRTDHLPPLARPSAWQWGGDFFDPEIPVSVELHFRLWDEATERFPAPGLGDFWGRRVTRSLEGRDYLALDPADGLGYSALHLLRHLLRGELRAASVWELGYFLDHHTGDGEFWARWRDLHPPELRRLQAIGFRLAAEWFGCGLSPEAQAEVDQLPANIGRWFEQYAASPAESLIRPNKDELWLHLRLLDSFGKKAAVARRRLLPSRLPQTPAQSGWGYARHLASRGLFHARALAPTLSRMLKTRAW